MVALEPLRDEIFGDRSVLFNVEVTCRDVIVV